MALLANRNKNHLIIQRPHKHRSIRLCMGGGDQGVQAGLSCRLGGSLGYGNPERDPVSLIHGIGDAQRRHFLTRLLNTEQKRRPPNLGDLRVRRQRRTANQRALPIQRQLLKTCGNQRAAAKPFQ